MYSSASDHHDSVTQVMDCAFPQCENGCEPVAADGECCPQCPDTCDGSGSGNNNNVCADGCRSWFDGCNTCTCKSLVVVAVNVQLFSKV